MIGRQPGALRRRRPSSFSRRGSTPARRGVRRRPPRPGPRALAAIVAVVALLAGGWMWLRTSSLVAVRRVQIQGVSGPDASLIRSALIASAHEMTTLDVRMGALRTAVAPYPVVKSLHVTTQFPHGMRIRVVEQVPVAIVVVAGRRIAVSADGTLLQGAATNPALPSISLAVGPGGTRLSGAALSEARLLGAAPFQLLGKVSEASTDAVHGLDAQLRSGPVIYFGSSDQLSAKWRAVAAVLADPSSAGADYLDVTDPARAAAGAGADTATTAATAGQGAGVATTPGG